MQIEIKSYNYILKEHLKLVLIFGCCYGSIISFIVYGPVLKQVAQGFDIPLLSSLGLACLVIGLKYHKPVENIAHKALLVLGTVTCFFLLIFSLLPYILQLASIALFGITAGWVIKRWAYSFASVKAENRLHTICLVLFIAYGSKYISHLLAPYLGASLITAVPALLILCSVIILNSLEQTIITEKKDTQISFKHKQLFILIFLIYFTAGITYSGIFPQVNAFALQRYFSVIPFLLAVIAAGIIGKSLGKNYLLYGGISFLGLSFAFHTVTSGVLSFFLVQGSSEIAWAFINSFVLVLLADQAFTHENIDLFFSGVASLVSGVLFGGFTVAVLVHHASLNPSIYGVIAHILLFIAIGFLARVLELHTEEKQPHAVFPTESIKFDAVTYLSSEFGLTPREIDVALLLLAGYNNSWIAKELSISINTAKFHIKNIFFKMKVNERNEIIKVMSDRNRTLPL